MLPFGLQTLIAQAAASEAGPSRQRKHHLVPRSYLERWADDRTIRVTRVDDRYSYRATPANAARETDYYRIEADHVDPAEIPPLIFETMLGSAEGYGKRAIDELLVKHPSQIDPKLMMGFVWFLAFQLTRGEAFRRQQRQAATDFFRMDTKDLTDQQLATRLGRDLTEAELAEIRDFVDQVQAGKIIAQPQTTMILGNAAATASQLCRHIMFREWYVMRTPNVLVTCDEPVVALGGPDHDRAERAGVESAAIILYPLAPHALLALFRQGTQVEPPLVELDHAETAEVNREIIANASRWAFERGSRRATLALTVPPLPAAATVMEGPLPGIGPPGQTVYRVCRPTRWANAEHVPPLPVARWWQ